MSLLYNKQLFWYSSYSKHIAKWPSKSFKMLENQRWTEIEFSIYKTIFRIFNSIQFNWYCLSSSNIMKWNEWINKWMTNSIFNLTFDYWIFNDTMLSTYRLLVLWNIFGCIYKRLHTISYLSRLQQIYLTVCYCAVKQKSKLNMAKMGVYFGSLIEMIFLKLFPQNILK